MATLREIRRRIDSVKSTQQVTKAMKMVSAAKLRRAQEKMMAARPYAGKIQELIRHLLESIDVSDDPLLEARFPQRVLIVPVTADRGLCGAFNSNIIKRTLQKIDEHKDKEISLVCVGRKGYEFFAKRNYPVEKHFVQFFNHLDYPDALRIADYLVDAYRSQSTDLVEVVFNEFKNAAQQNIVVSQYLPIIPLHFEEENRIEYIYEPDPRTLLSSLLPKYLNIQMWRALLESNAAEQGARMTAMENATDNASDMIHDLTLYYNRARQAAITTEISEIVGGAEALKSE